MCRRAPRENERKCRQVLHAHLILPGVGILVLNTSLVVWRFGQLVLIALHVSLCLFMSWKDPLIKLDLFWWIKYWGEETRCTHNFGLCLHVVNTWNLRACRANENANRSLSHPQTIPWLKQYVCCCSLWPFWSTLVCSDWSWTSLVALGTIHKALHITVARNRTLLPQHDWRVHWLDSKLH